MSANRTEAGTGRFPAIIGALFLLLAAILFLPGHATAQLAPAKEGEAAAAPADPFGRDSPRGLVKGLVDALAAQDHERAAQYLDLQAVRRSARGERGPELARQLGALLDAGGSLVPVSALSSATTGDVNDRLPPDQERIGSLPTEDGDLPLIAEAVESDGNPVWLVSSDTLAAMPTVAQPPPSAGIRERLPEEFSNIQVGGAPLVDWLILLVLGSLLYLLVRLVFAGFLFLLARTRRNEQASPLYRFAEAASSPLSLYLAMLLFLGATRTLHVAIVARELLSRMAGAVALLALAWFLWRLIDAAADLLALRMDRHERRRAKAVILFARRAAKLILVALATIAFLDSFGVDITAGVAALGLGGLALALGAQKTIENFVGGVSVLADQPVRVGDFCRVGDVVGTVEDIGIRSTRIRTTERTRVTIPNGNFSSLQIENFATRDRFLFNPVINLARDLDADGIGRVLGAIRAALAEAGFVAEGGRASFSGFGRDSFDVEIFAYLETGDFEESVKLRERLLLDIMRRVAAAGGHFAVPTTQVRMVPESPERSAFAFDPED